MINVEMLKDAYDDACDITLLVSTDSDLSVPIEAIRQVSNANRLYSNGRIRSQGGDE
ncbi:MAG: hypothetical protein ACYCXT_13515 [Acidiferrobacteraceae bacterium]